MLIRFSPRLRFIETPGSGTETPPAGAAAGAATAPDATPAATAPSTPVTDATRGYPANTAIVDMTPEQQVAYWKGHARRHESEATAAKAELADSVAAGRTDDEKRQDALRDEGKALGAAPFIAGTVAAEIRVATGKTKEEVATLLAFVDVTKFLTEGAIDESKIAAYAASVGTAPAEPPRGPRDTALDAASAMTRGRPGAQRTGGSISERRAELAKAHAAK